MKVLLKAHKVGNPSERGQFIIDYPRDTLEADYALRLALNALIGTEESSTWYIDSWERSYNDEEKEDVEVNW